MLLEKNCSKIIKTFPKNPLNSKNYSVTNVTAFCEIFTPGLIMREKDQVIDVTNKGTILKSTKFMKTMQILLLTIGSTLCVLYWIIGLHHYYNACPM